MGARSFDTVLITGGAGFIGTNLIRWALSERPWRIVNLDNLSYAGSGENLADLAAEPRYRFVKADVCDLDAVRAVLEEERPQLVMHLAAESHVDRSIHASAPFLRTNVEGTRAVLDAARALDPAPRVLYCSTDEVYGDLGPDDPQFTEETPLNPSSPYSVSKAAGDMLARATHRTFGLDVVVTRCSNNYGPWQFPEKLIPLMATNALDDLELPVYGDGRNVRDWIHVLDHCRGMVAVAERAEAGSAYNLGGGCEKPNLDVVRGILRALGKPESLIRFVTDRPGHDRRYAVAWRKAERDLGWRPEADFDQALADTLAWYQEHQPWWRRLKDAEYRAFYEKQYGVVTSAKEAGPMTDGPVLVLGAGGLLGRAVLAACAGAGCEAVGLERAECDIAEPGAVARALSECGATLCVNAAAATDVDRCEREPAWGWRVNALGPRLVARACHEGGARCVHVSTDYVFDGEKGSPYDESDAPTPLSAYARGKLAGERAVLLEQPEALVLRTAWLFGPGGRNFVSQMPRLLRERGRIEAVGDQWSSPTAARDLAAWILANVGPAAGGVYHTVNGGALSYAEAARVIAEALGLDPHASVGEVSGSTLTRPARRPRMSALTSAALPAEGLAELRPAREALRDLALAS